jgi:deaminated glutathione amidase
MRAFTAAAIQFAPVPGPLTAASVAANIAKAVALVDACAEATGAELIVLPESCTTGFTPGIPAAELWELVSEVPGEVSESLREIARDRGVHLCFGTYERGAAPGIVHNASVLLGPAGDVLGVYRKTHPFCSEDVRRGGWVTAGDEVCVVDTELGRIGMAICFDGDFPELWRIQAVRGAEIICRPSALLRSADIWELTTRARAYDNHTYVIGANATGVDPAGVIYFGNSMIVSPIAEVLARAASHESWISARLEPSMTSLTPGSSVPQSFHHLTERNLPLYERYAKDLLS